MPLPFHAISFDDLPLLRKYLPFYGNGDCNLSIASLLTRGPERGTELCELHNHLLVKWRAEGFEEPVLQFPIGCCVGVDLIHEIEAALSEEGESLRLYGSVPELLLWVQKLMPERSFVVTSASAGWDYLYRRDTFATLEGRPMAKKRNFTRRYHAANPNATFVPLSDETMQLLKAFLSEWYEAEGEMTKSLLEERAAIETALEHREALNLSGGLLMSEGRVDGFTYGTLVAKDIFAVHIEKSPTRRNRRLSGALERLCEITPRRRRVPQSRRRHRNSRTQKSKTRLDALRHDPKGRRRNRPRQLRHNKRSSGQNFQIFPVF